MRKRINPISSKIDWSTLEKEYQESKQLTKDAKKDLKRNIFEMKKKIYDGKYQMLMVEINIPDYEAIERLHIEQKYGTNPLIMPTAEWSKQLKFDKKNKAMEQELQILQKQNARILIK